MQDQPLRRWLRQVGAHEGFAGAMDLLGGLLPGGAAAFAVDADRNVVWWSGEDLLGFPTDQIVGSHCLKSNRCPQCMAGCGISQHGEVRDVPLVYLDSQGRQVRVRKTGRAFAAPDGSFLGGIEVLIPEESAARAAAPTAAPRKDDAADFHGFLTTDVGLLRTLQIIRDVSATEAPVLVRGEIGTGRELVARALHLESHRRDGPFLAVGCAAFSASVLESQLFGHAEGAVRGAAGERAGLFERAEGGTLFVDGVGELPPRLQVRLLRVLRDRVITPVGSDREISVDVRLVAATRRALRAETRAGHFRADLLDQLRAVPVYIPPLRERRGDVELLLWRFISRHNRGGPRGVQRVSPDAMRALLDHSWPGNVRELSSAVRYAFAVGRGPELTLGDLPPELRARPATSALESPAEPDEVTRIRHALATTHGNIGEAAELFGVSRPTFWRKRKKYGI